MKIVIVWKTRGRELTKYANNGIGFVSQNGSLKNNLWNERMGVLSSMASERRYI